MPVINLTMNQWGLVLRTIRHMLRDHGVPESERKDLAVAEDRIIDMAFQIAKEMDDMQTSKKAPEEAAWQIIAQQHAKDVLKERERQEKEYGKDKKEIKESYPHPNHMD